MLPIRFRTVFSAGLVILFSFGACLFGQEESLPVPADITPPQWAPKTATFINMLQIGRAVPDAEGAKLAFQLPDYVWDEKKETKTFSTWVKKTRIVKQDDGSEIEEDYIEEEALPPQTFTSLVPRVVGHREFEADLAHVEAKSLSNSNIPHEELIRRLKASPTVLIEVADDPKIAKVEIDPFFLPVITPDLLILIVPSKDYYKSLKPEKYQESPSETEVSKGAAGE